MMASTAWATAWHSAKQYLDVLSTGEADNGGDGVDVIKDIIAAREHFAFIKIGKHATIITGAVMANTLTTLSRNYLCDRTSWRSMVSSMVVRQAFR